MAELRRPVSIHTVWLHVDRLDRKDGRVWAVQWRDARGAHYRTAHEVSTLAPGITLHFDGGPQPRAVVLFSPATVKVFFRRRRWRAVIAVASPQ